MIKKIILFGDFASKDFDDFWSRDYVFLKTSALTRLAYMLRAKGYEVKQVHHCTSFNKDELEYIMKEFAQGEKVLIGLSSSFITSINRIDYRFHASDRKDYKQEDVGNFWGEPAFKFFLNVCLLGKKNQFPILMGGFDIMRYKFKTTEDRRAWGMDYLKQMVDYFVMGNNIDVIENVCNNRPVKHFTMAGARIATSEAVTDFSDCASTPIYDDHIGHDESLITEIGAGCVFSCSFCTYSLLGKKAFEYTRTYESLKKEIVSNYENFGSRFYQLTDNMVNDYPEKLKYMAKIRNDTGIDLRWAGYARLDTIRKKEHAEMFKESGCAGVIFGIESFNKETGAYIGKMTDKDKLMESLNLFRDAVGDTAIASGSFIAGAPKESKEQLAKTYEWLCSSEGKHYLDHFIFTPLFIVPGVNETNDITKSRNNPFRDYVLDNGEDGRRGTGWTSPWGTYKEFQNLAIHYSRANNRSVTEAEAAHAMRGVFALPILHNLFEGKIEGVVKSIREGKKINVEYKEQLKFNNKKAIQDYKLKLLK